MLTGSARSRERRAETKARQQREKNPSSSVTTPTETIETVSTRTEEDTQPVQSTASYRTTTTNNMAELDRIKSEAEEIQVKINERRAQEKADKAAAAADGTGTGTGDGTTGGTGTGTTDPFASLDDRRAVIEQKYEDEREQIFADYDELEKTASREYRSMIKGIKSQFENRINLMKDTNSRTLAAQGVNNQRSGNARYLAEMSAGLMTNEEQMGHMRVMQIESEMTSLITAAAAAKQEGDMEAFNSMYDAIGDAFDRMNDQVTNNFNNAVKRNQEIRATNKELRDKEKADLDAMLSKSERAAPALAERLNGLSVEEQSAVLEAYSETSGIPIDLLLGDIATAAADLEYRGLQADNIANQIANRNAGTAIDQQRENRLSTDAAKKEEKEATQYQKFTENIINEVSTLADIQYAIEDDPETLAQVKNELNSLGLYSSVPPAWFIEDEQQKEQQTIPTDDMLTRWTTYKDKVIGVL